MARFLAGPPCRRTISRLLLLAAVLATVSCRRSEVATPPAVTTSDRANRSDSPTLFQDVTASSGVHHTYRSGQEAGQYTMLELLGGGVGLLDFDGDGLLDIFVTGGGRFEGPDKKVIKGCPCRLYRNLGNWKFQDVTAEAGLANIEFYSHGCAVADYDRDGWPDLLVTGYGRLALFHNESDGKGGRRFVEVTKEAGLERGHFWSTSAGWADLDGDGYPDLYVCQYVDWSFANHPICPGYANNVARDNCSPRQFAAVAHALYQNVPFPLTPNPSPPEYRGRGKTSSPSPLGGEGLGVRGEGSRRRFVDVSKEAGLRVPPRADLDYGKGLGVLLVDVNGDGKPDIYVANDTTDNFLYLNISTPGKLRFQERGMELGVARDGAGTPNGSMGVDADDYDGSGRPSIWVTNYEGELHALYQNVVQEGQQYFRYSTQAAGIAVLGTQYVGFGTGFFDLDNDGWPDLMISNGHVIHHPRNGRKEQRPVLLHNEGNGRFRDITVQGGAYFQMEHLARGVAVGDLDNDGRPDLVISHVDEPVVVLRNVTGEPGPRAHWLGVELAARDHRDLVGARVVLEGAGRRLLRFAKGGGSYMSSGDRRLLFGLGTTQEVGKITVEWPSGEPRVQSFSGVGIDQYWRLEQGAAAARPVSAGQKAHGAVKAIEPRG
jgi:enediyne biosynthesis protein E4